MATEACTSGRLREPDGSRQPRSGVSGLSAAIVFKFEDSKSATIIEASGPIWLVEPRLEAEALAFEVETLAGNAERFRGRFHLALVFAERGLDHFAFDARQRRQQLVEPGIRGGAADRRVGA